MSTSGMVAMKSDVRRNLMLWSGWLAGPVAWFAQLVMVYALADGACQVRGRLPILHLASAACLLVVILGGLASRSWSRDGSPGSGDDRAIRERFMATQGVLCSSLFSAFVIAQWIAVIVLDPCPL